MVISWEMPEVNRGFTVKNQAYMVDHPRDRNWLIVISLVIVSPHTHRIHGAAIYGNMDSINIPLKC